MTNVFSRMGLLGCLMALAVFIHPCAAQAQNVNNCAWPLEISPEGYGNATGPELLARYFFVPFDARSDSLLIKGAYPHARYFSYVVYQDETPTAIIGDLYDAQIAPDPGSVNPYVRPGDKRGHTAHGRSTQHADNGTYTIVVSHTKPSAGNTMGVAPRPLRLDLAADLHTECRSDLERPQSHRVGTAAFRIGDAGGREPNAIAVLANQRPARR